MPLGSISKLLFKSLLYLELESGLRADHILNNPSTIPVANLLDIEGQNATDIKGGMTIYYTQKDFDSNGDQYITAFPPVSILSQVLPTVA